MIDEDYRLNHLADFNMTLSFSLRQEHQLPNLLAATEISDQQLKRDQIDPGSLPYSKLQ